MKITTLRKKLDSIGYDDALEKTKEGNTELTTQFEKSQEALAVVFKN